MWIVFGKFSTFQKHLASQYLSTHGAPGQNRAFWNPLRRPIYQFVHAFLQPDFYLGSYLSIYQFRRKSKGQPQGSNFLNCSTTNAISSRRTLLVEISFWWLEGVWEIEFFPTKYRKPVFANLMAPQGVIVVLESFSPTFGGGAGGFLAPTCSGFSCVIA